jgi:hypothetical protein
MNIEEKIKPWLEEPFDKKTRDQVKALISKPY